MDEITERFRNAITCGIGEAIYLQRQNRSHDFSTEILRAIRKNLALDPQCEGDRSGYLVDLVDESKSKAFMIKKLVSKLTEVNRNKWDINQLLNVARELYVRYETDAIRQAITDAYVHLQNKENPWVGQDVVLKILGMEGLHIIAKKRGTEIRKDKSEWEDKYIIEQFQKENPQIKVMKIIQKWALTDIDIKAYLKAIDESREMKLLKARKPITTYEAIAANIQRLKVVPIGPRWISKISENDFLKLVHDFEGETERIKQEKYLRIFARRKYPGSYEKIFKLAKMRKNKEDRLIEFACESLSHFMADDLRDFAIKKIAQVKKPCDYLPLLKSNYRKGDSKLLCEVIARNTSYDSLHQLCWSIISIYENVKTTECKRPLELLYRRLNCSIHRSDLLDIMIENNVLSKKLMAEIKFDSNQEIRKKWKLLTK